MMSRTAQVLQHLFSPETDVATKLNITPRMLSRIQADDRNVRPWMMRYLIDRWRVNPLYIYAGAKDMLLSSK
jgi:hypothetical protein